LTDKDDGSSAPLTFGHSGHNKKLSYHKRIARQQRRQSNNSKFSGEEFFTREETHGTPVVAAAARSINFTWSSYSREETLFCDILGCGGGQFC